jgi:CubicO group peptidase (beta-lactamase class C family)
VNGLYKVHSDMVRQGRRWLLRAGRDVAVLAVILIAGMPAGAVRSGLAHGLAAPPDPGEPVEETFEAVADAMVATARPAVNYGSGDTISVGYFSGDGASTYRGLARFDLSSLPAEAVIISADLSLYADAGTVSKQIQARRLTGDWAEITATWNNQPDAEAPQASRIVGQEAGAYSWDVRQTVQDWVSGEQANYGFLLRATDEAENGYRNFRSREAAEGVPGVANVQLIVTWMLPVGPTDPGPEPPLENSYLPLVFTPQSGEPVPIEVSPCPQLPVWALRRGMDAAHYQQSVDDYGAAGFRPISVTAEGEGDQARFDVVWVQDGLYVDNWSLRHDMTSDDLQNEFDAEKTLGFRPAFVDAYGQGGNTRYVAGWVKDDLATHMNHGLSRADFTDTLVYSDTLKGWTLAPAEDGWRPLWVSVNGAPSDPRFSAIFIQDGKAGVLDFDKTFSELKDLNGSRTSQGYRLLHLSGYLVDPDPDISNDDGVRYAASWVKDPAECGYVKWQVLQDQSDLGLDLEALNASGIREKTFTDPTLYLNTDDLQNQFRRGRFEISASGDVTLSSLTRIDESVPGAVFEDGDVILLQPKIGQIITVKETTDGNINLKAPEDGADATADGGQKFVMRGYNYILALKYDASSANWVELQRNGLPHERYWPISVDEFSTNDGRRYNSVWVQYDPDRDEHTTYAPGDDPTYFQTLDDTMLGYMEKRDIPGGALAVTKDGRLVMERGYTWEPDGTAYVSPDAKFRLASVSKPLTSAAVVRLMEAAGLTLDTPIHILLGEGWDDPEYTHVTVRQLLNHIGGWDRDISFDPMFIDKTVCTYNEQPLPVTPQEIIEYMKTQPLDHVPGTVFNYSNFGYSLLGRIIEALTGQTYDNYMRNNIFIPFGMLDTWPGKNYETEAYFSEVKYYTPRNTLARDKNDGTAVDEDLICTPDSAERVMLTYGGFNIEDLDSHGGWISTAADLNRFLVAINKGSLLDSSQYVQVFQRPQGGSPRVLFWDGGSLADGTIQALTPGITWPGITAPGQDLFVGRGLSTFAGLNVELAAPGAGYSLKVDYWNGSTFNPLTEDDNDLVDGTNNLSQSGKITFTPPDDWTPTALANQTRYWLRVRTGSASTSAAKFDILEPDYDYSSYYGAGWFIDETTQRLNFQIGVNSFSKGDWIAGTTSETVAQIKDVVVQTPPGVTPTAGYLILENVKGGPFWVDELITDHHGDSALTNGPGVPETFTANHDGILDGSRTFLYRRSDGVTWAALFNMRVGDSSIPLYMPGGTAVNSINSDINNLTASDWPAYDLFP